MTSSTPGIDGLVEVFSSSSGRRQRVPAHWVGDPVLGKDFVPTPAQRQLDGDLGPIPTDADKADDIRAYAEQAGIDTGSARSKVELVAAIEAAFAPGAYQVGVQLVPLTDPDVDEPAEPVVLEQQPPATPVTPDPDAGSTETPVAGGQE